METRLFRTTFFTDDAACRGFCRLEGLQAAVDETIRYSSQVFVEASLLLHIFLLQRCSDSELPIEKYNFTFFNNVIAAVTR